MLNNAFALRNQLIYGLDAPKPCFSRETRSPRNCDTGKPFGVPSLGMSVCVFAMMTDGMTRRFGAAAK